MKSNFEFLGGGEGGKSLQDVKMDKTTGRKKETKHCVFNSSRVELERGRPPVGRALPGSLKKEPAEGIVLP